ncbi:MAG: glycosyltransferase family 39 protein [Verrucomicrobiota bacterium]
MRFGPKMRQPARSDAAWAIGLSLGWAALLIVAQRDTGFARDEGFYFRFGQMAWQWFAELLHHPHVALTRTSIDAHFGGNFEHPALMKTLFGASEALFHETLGLTSASTGFRLPGILVSSAAVGLCYQFGADVAGRRTGLAAALLYATLPRAFFHAQLAAFDGAVATMWLAVVWAYWRALSRPRWAIICGLLFGLALATKLNAFFLPPVLLVHWLVHITRGRGDRRSGWVFVAMAVGGPLVLIGHWPWVWTDTFSRLGQYLSFHLHHHYYNTAYFNRNYNRPPLPPEYAFVLTAFTTPFVTLALGAAGFALLCRRQPVEPSADQSPPQPTHLALLWGLNFLVPLLIIARPKTPIFGGTKHWLNAMPFLALLGGVALARATQGLRRPAVALVMALAVAPGAVDTFHAHPFGLSQYSALAGGVPGAADYGMLRQFWGYPVRPLLPWINQIMPPASLVYWHDTNYDSLVTYKQDGLLRPDIRDAGWEEQGVRASHLALVIHELHFAKVEMWIWNDYRTATPTRVESLDGVPLVTVYTRPPGGH